jgi:cobalt-zinc-cadmium efflux system membrane fusion protein
MKVFNPIRPREAGAVRTLTAALLTILSIALVLAAVILSLSGCAPRSDPPAAASSAAGPLPAGAVAVVNIDDAMASAIRVGPVEVRRLPRQIRTTGKVQLDESRVARLAAPVAGLVSGLHVAVGDRVGQGQPLFYLNSRDAATAVEDAVDAQHDLDLAEKVATMTQDLYDHQASSKLALQQAQNDLAKARFRVERTQAALATIGLGPVGDLNQLDARVPVASPISGAVIERHLSDGQFAQADSSPLLTIADLSTVWVEADVFERDLHLVRAGEQADVATNAYPDVQFRAQVTRVSDVLDPTTRTVKVRFLVANPQLRLKPEMFATVTLLVDEVESAVTVPASAVITEGEKTFVYVAIADHAFARRLVQTVADSREVRRIVQGLDERDRVVTAGALLLRSQENRVAN